ncbi:TPA: hypothetical protein QHD31_004557 [Raoultella ornithinolytica]|nr:hypothetical protein [Raoultella ornithinolytica]
MAPVLDQSYSIFGCGRGYQLYVLGWKMSRNGIRSLVILLLIMSVVWAAVIGKTLHAAGVFNG